MNRPWLTSDRAASAFAERTWPEVKWYDALLAELGRAFRPRLQSVRIQQRLLVALTQLKARRLVHLDTDALGARAEALRPELLRRGFTLGTTADAFALVVEATRRTMGFRHHDVQILGAAQILGGRIAEMATGEGKTVTAALAAAAAALAGASVQVITVNEYLSERDFEELRPIYAMLRLSSAYVAPDADPQAKAGAYGCSITYVTNKTLVFDYLRARMDREGRDTRARFAAAGVARPKQLHRPMPAGLEFCIVDEADSILIDEAQTPLLIAAEDEGLDPEDCRIALELAAALEPDVHFRREEARRRIILLGAGETALEAATAGRPGLWQVPLAREEMVRQALTALHLYHRDEHYIVLENKVQIVDEFTGRVLADRQWQAGLHQMVEVKEGLEASAARKTIAQITFQRFFRRYLWFGGMTGTAGEVARELRNVYGLDVVRIPTHRRSRRVNRGTRVFASEQAKLDALAIRVRKIHAMGRPILIGTRSIEVSQNVSKALSHAGLDHVVLNARQDGEEADIIARAGLPGAITVATNMAGRGTDIRLDPEARRRGGLHVILTGYHESARIDRQFYGRSGRQGDPGVQETFVALDDDLFMRHARLGVRLVRILTLGYPGRLPSVSGLILRLLAQNAAEAQAFRIRRQTLARSDKLEKSLAFTRRPV